MFSELCSVYSDTSLLSRDRLRYKKLIPNNLLLKNREFLYQVKCLEQRKELFHLPRFADYVRVHTSSLPESQRSLPQPESLRSVGRDVIKPTSKMSKANLGMESNRPPWRNLVARSHSRRSAQR